MIPQAASLFPFLMVFVIFYVLVFRPQMKARKEHQQMLTNLNKYDEVVAAGGIFGTIVNIKSETVTLRVDENVRIEVEKSSIVRLVKSRPAETSSVPSESKA